MSPSFTQILNVTRSGMLSRLLNLDITSDNLSNINTTGFKRGRGNFQEALAEKQLGGVSLPATQVAMEQGSLKTTGNPLDLAIQGEGFFAVRLPDDRLGYTRDGSFYLDNRRQLVNANGFRLEWDGEIPEGAQDVHVNPDGVVMADQDGTWVEAGRIEISRFTNPGAMTRYGQNLWLENDLSGQAEAAAPGSGSLGQVLGETVEMSNVNMAEEMVNMITLQRSFEMSLRTFQQTDQMLEQAIHVRKA